MFGAKGEFLDAWNYDAYGGYYYVDFFNSNSKYLSFANIDNALLVTGTAANPVCISGPPCIRYNIWRDGGVTPQQLQYLYLTGTGSGSYSMRTLHGEITGDLGHYGLTLPTARDGLAVNIGYEHRNEHQFFNPDSAEISGQLSDFGSAAVPIDATDAVSEEWVAGDAGPGQGLCQGTDVRYRVPPFELHLQWRRQHLQVRAAVGAAP